VASAIDWRPTVDEGEGPRGRNAMRERLGSIRVRTTAAAVLVVGVALALAAIAMVTLLERSLRQNVRTSAMLRAEEIAVELASRIPTDELGLGGADEDEEFVQVLDADENVVIASPNVASRPAIVALAPGETRAIGPRSPPDVEPFDDPFLTVASSPVGSEQQLIVIVGRNLEDTEEARRALIRVLAVALPLLLVVVGVVTWRVAAKALSPVDAIRAEVDAISSRDLHRRVSDPPGDDELSRLAATMNRMLERLEAGRLRERSFVSDASHELRSPVATIRQYAEVALTHPTQTDIRELAEVVLEEDVRLQRLVEDLLLLTRIDEGTLAPPTEPIDLDDLVLEEAKRLRGASNLRIDIRRLSPGRVLGDRAQLERLIRNLTDNAVRHARTTIALSLMERDGEVVLHVDDDGTGVDDAERERIFDRFVRLDEARDRDSGGSGLGLAIVREMATFHGGTVDMMPSELGGTGFEVRFPSHPD
jgi:signal transduction histidine kinase